MSFPALHYVPCLRWKQGEYKAISLLSNAARELITPLIEVPEKGYDFETKTDKKSLDDHLAPFAKRVRSNWQQRSCFVDLNWILPSERLKGGIHPVRYIFEQLNLQGCHAIPVTDLDRDPQYQQEVKRAASRDKRGLCVRLGIESAAKSNLRGSISALLGNNIAVEECDFILDLEAPPNFLPLDGFANLIQAIINQLPYLAKWRSFTLMGTSFPSSMAEIQSSPMVVPRHEWLLYQLLRTKLGSIDCRIPTFGDYAISHPEVLQVDMRLVKPSATIRYTIDDAWLIIKGPNVRDYGYGQYLDHCKTLTADPRFLGSNFSEADKYISDCAAGRAKTGNLSTWRWIGTNHHLEKVALDVANLFAS